MKYGLVVPFYNYEKRVGDTLEKISVWHRNLSADQKFHICFIDDGSTDSTKAILLNFQKDYPDWVSVIPFEINQGKGAAIKAGFQFLSSKCEYLFFTDCDLHYGLSIFTERFIPLLQENDLVIADRSWVASSNHEAISRRLSSYIFNRVMGLFTGVTLRDSQAGCKGFKVASCMPIFNLLRIHGFSFDVEVLSIALFYRFRIRQVPISFKYDHEFPDDSSIKIIRSSLKMFYDVLCINMRWKSGAYKSAELEKRINDQVFIVESIITK